MNPIAFAMRRPITVMVAIAGIIVGSVLAVSRMKVDIFPSLNLPVIYVCQPYGGMDPAQMEGLITYYYEYHFLYINGIHHVESKNIQGLALMKLNFHPGTDMAQAMAETIQYVNRARAFMPAGTVGPFVMRFDTGSVPVGFLVFESETRSIKDIQDLALNRVRPMFASLPGVSAPPPFGGNARTIVLRVSPDKLRAYNTSPEEVIAALTSGNTVSPSGNVRIKDRMPIVPSNAMVLDPQELGKIPLRPGSNIYLRDLGANVVQDATDIPTGYALVNGRQAVYIPVTKRADASTLAVIKEVNANLPRMQKEIPDDINVRLVFDQSPYVTNAITTVGIEGLLGALLTGLMVFLFLHDWRSVIVVVLNIPFALLGAVVALWLTGQTINLMTLGGLALAVGILVDEATVEVENIHAQFEHTPNIARAVREGNAQTAVPRLLAMLCILAVFLPSFFMQGAAQALFVPLSLAVGFAMVTSYLLSSTFVPVLSVWLLRHHRVVGARKRTFFVRLRDAYAALARAVVRGRWVVLPAYVVVVALVIWLAGGYVGREIFPKVDAGQFQLRLRAPTGTRIERTQEITQQALKIIQEKVGPKNVAISLGYVGVVPSSYPINAVYQWMGGPEEAVLRVALKRGSGIATEPLEEQLRKELPQQLAEWLRPKLTAEGFSPREIEERVTGLRFSFEPADIVNTVMSFGSPTPVEVVVSGTSLTDDRAHAEKIKEQLNEISALRDLQFGQSLDYPTVSVTLDRELTGTRRSGLTAESLTRSLVAGTSSSRFVVPNYWRDPKTGIAYQVQVEIPIERMNSAEEVGLIPIKHSSDGDLLLQDVAKVEPGIMPGEYDRYNMRRLVSMTGNIQGQDLGRVATNIDRAIRLANESQWAPYRDEEGNRHEDDKGKPGWKNAISGEIVYQPRPPVAPPRGMQVDVRGQVEPMQQMFGGLAGGSWFSGLTLGLGMAVVVIFLLLTAYFQSLRLALVVVTTAPAVVAGVALALVVTGTTLNIQSFMGAIMAIGVATANAILLITFAERARRQGAPAGVAAIDGAQHRLRPILMTSFAMIAGMVPMALALGEGGQQVAPLGRAVIGGLVAATLATLLVLPCVFATVLRGAGTRSVSLDPDDAESPHYAPLQGARIHSPRG